MSDPIIVDISHYQPDPDWQKLKAGGIVGVILKATQGTTYVDPTFRSRYDAAIAAGLAVSSYHFLQAGNIQAQMNFYLNTLKPRDGERMCIDHESDASLKELEQAVAYLLTDSRNIQVTVYSGNLIKEQLGGGYSEILSGTSLWVAQYTSAAAPSWTRGTWPTWSLWQYTDAANVAGISGNVDGNRFNGSPGNAVKWLGPAAQPEPEPASDLSMVVALSQPGVAPPKSIKVSVTWNGEQVA